jgi:hypothetical protein
LCKHTIERSIPAACSARLDSGRRRWILLESMEGKMISARVDNSATLLRNLLSLAAMLWLLLVNLAAAQTTVSPSSIAFGNVVVNETSAVMKLTLKNAQKTAVSVQSLTLPSSVYGFDAGTTTCSNSTTLAAGAVCTIGLTLTPTGLGAITPGNLTITANAGNSPQTVALTGAGIAPTTLSATTIAFGNVVTNEISAVKAFTLKNNQLIALNIQSLTLPGGGYAFDKSTTCGNPGALAAGATCTIALTLTPAGLGAVSPGNLTITTDAGNSPQNVALTGTGIAATTLSATTLAFGNVVVNDTSAIKTVTLKNNQLIALNIQSLTLPGGGYAFDNSTTCGNPGALAAGSTCTIALTLTPAALGAVPAGSLTIATNAGNSPQNVALTGTGVAQTTLTPSTVSFGNVVTSTASATKTLTLTNQQKGTLTINSVVLAGPFALDTSAITTCPLVGGAVTGTLAGGASCVLGAIFNPTANGATSGQITVIDSATTGPVQTKLLGTGVAAATLSASTVAFGNVVVNTTSATKSLTLTNNQTTALTLSSILVSGPYAIVAGSTTCTTSTPVAPSGTCTIGLQFLPTAVGTAAASALTIADNAVVGAQALTASLTGAGVTAVTLTPATLAFGTVVVGEAANKSVTLKNNQTVALTIDAITGFSGGYALNSASSNCPMTPLTLAAGSSCTIGVTLTATSLGSQPGSVKVVHNAAGSPQSFALSGNAVAPVVLSPTSLTFSAQQEGTTSAAKTVKVTNEQNVALSIGSVSITGADSSDFAVTSQCPIAPSTLGATKSCTLSVTFAPTATGTRTATMSLADDATGSPQTIALSGSGIAPLLVSPTSITSFSAAVGTLSAYKTITITNNASTTAHIFSFQFGGDFKQSATTCGATASAPPPYTLAAGKSCTVAATFAPLIGGTRDGQLQVYDDAVTSPQVVNLSGTGTAPLTLSASALTFSAQKLGTISPPKNITLTNHETQAESFTLTPSANFNATSNCANGVIASNSSCILSIVFAPAASATAGPLSGSLTVADTAAIGSPLTVSLSGSASTTNPPPAVAIVAPGAGAAGTTVNVVITGNGWTHFSSSSAISFVDTNSSKYASDITVQSFTAISPNEIDATLQLTGGSSAIYGARNIYIKTPLTGGGMETASLLQAFIIADPNQAHTVTSISPNFGAQGQTLNVSLTAAGTNFVQGTTFANFGSGITINWLNILDATDAQANITISNTTTVGYRTVTLMTGGEYATSSPQGFQIGPNNAALLSINPTSSGQGQSGAMMLTASGTHFQPDATQVSIGGGVIVGDVTVTSATTATAQYAVPANGAVGVQNVTVSTGGEIATLANAFTIVGTTPYLSAILPGSGLQGQTLNVEIQGVNTNFNGSAILADFTGEIAVNSIVVNSPTDVVVNVTISQYANVGSITARLTSGPAGAATIFPFTFTVNSAGEQIVSVTPSSVAQGAQVTLSVVGAGTSWNSATTKAAFYPQLVPTPSVDLISVTDTTHASLNIAVPTNTPPGSYGFYLQTGGQTVSAAITVYAQTPTLTMSPANGMPGSSFSVSFTGHFTHFSQANTLPVISGEGVTLSNFTVTSPQSATGTITIASWAPVTTSYTTLRLVTFTTGGEIVKTHFNVNYASIADISPWGAAQNQTLDVAITGSNTHFVAGTTNVLFGPQITVNTVTVTDSSHLTANITTDYMYSGVTTATPPGSQEVFVNTGTEQLLSGFYVAPPASPSLVSVCVTGITPCVSSAAQGSTVQVTITGSLTHWVQGTTEAILGAGVTVSNLTILSPTTATATIAVLPTAPLGGNSVTMITGTEIVGGAGFNVTPSSAAIVSVEPPLQDCLNNLALQPYCPGNPSGTTEPWEVSQLQTAVLNIVGVGTHWLQGDTAISWQDSNGLPESGVQVDQLTVTSPTTATMQITVLSSAPVGFTGLTATTDGEVVSYAQAIDVEENFPAMLAITPNGGEQGASMTVQVLGRATSWKQGLTTVAFNQDIAVNSVTVLDSFNLTANITVSPWAYIDYLYCGHVLTVTTGTEQVNTSSINDNFCVAQGAAQINSVSPLSGPQGSTETVTIIGSDTNFLAGVTGVSFGDPNFQVGQITVNSPTSLTVPVAITTAAQTGYKQVTVSTYGEVATQQYSFIVNPGVGTLNEADPNQAEQGVQKLDVVLTGQYTNFGAGTTATFGAGITVNSVTVTSATTLTANISIDPLSYTGGRTVTVTTPNVPCAVLANSPNACQAGATTGSEIVSNNAFTIIPGPAIISQIAPGTGNQGQEVVFTITGANTHWQQNFTQFYIPGVGSDITVNSVVINTPTSATVDMSISGTAYPGARSIFMVTAGESLVDRGGFVITGGIPVITYLSPNNANPGTQQLEVAIHGLFTKWDGTSTVSIGPGVTVTSFQVGDATDIEAVINIDPAAQIGYRTVVVQTGTQILTGNFLVAAPAPPPTPYIWYFWPMAGLPGQTFTINFTGMYTHWDPTPITGTQISFGSGITVNSYQITGANTATANITITATQAQTNLIVFTTGAETESTYFSVVVQSPTLSFVDPGAAMQGTQNLTVNILGQYTTFDSTTRFNFGPGITVNGPPTILGPTIATQSISVGQEAVTGYNAVSATTLTGGAQTVGGASFQITPSLALISAVAPNTALQGNTLAVEVTGQNTHWSGATSFSFGAGIIVAVATVNSATDASLTIVIPPLASEGPTWVQAKTAGEVATLNNGFVVQPGTPLLLSSGPGSLEQQSSAIFTILSQATKWSAANPPTVSYGAGITLANVNVTGPTSMTVNGAVLPTTNVGWRDLTVTTGTQVLSLPSALYVAPGPAAINSIAPSSGGQGVNLPTVTITGVNTHWQQGVTALSFPNVLVSSFTVTSPTTIVANITVNTTAGAGFIPTITATTGGEVAAISNGFTVIQTQAELLAVVAGSGYQGQTETITLTGYNTHFSSSSVVSFGTGITVNAVNALSAGSLQATLTIQPTTLMGWRNVSVTTGSEVVSLNNAFQVTVGQAAIQALAPNSGQQDTSLTVLVTGSQSNFAAGGTSASFSGGISVTGITVVDLLHAKVNITIPANVAVGACDVTLTTGGETATILGGFSVTSGSPRVSSVSPPTGHQGNSKLSVALTGLYSHFVNGTSTANFGAGITVNSLTVSDATDATAVITIDAAATLGSRTVSVTTGTETATMVGGFTVLAGLPALVSAAPVTGQAGQTLNVVLNGAFTTFQQNFSTVSFGPGVAVNAVTVSSLTQLSANISIDPNATTGLRDISVTTNSQTVTLSGGFTITPGIPVITVINPNIGVPNATVTVNITGQYTNWVNGTTTVSFGAGITVGTGAEGAAGPVTVNSPTSLTATLSIDPSAAFGPRDVIVTTGAEIDTVAAGFTVQPAAISPPTLISFSPGYYSSGMPINGSLVAVFSQPMDRSTINTGNVLLYLTSNPSQGNIAAPGTVTLDASGRVLTFTPAAALAVNSTYYFELNSGIQDASGNTFNSWGAYLYTVFAADVMPPTVIAANPPANVLGVGTNATVQLEFSADMNQATQTGLTVSTGGSAVPGSYSWNSSPNCGQGWWWCGANGPGTVLTFTPSAPWQANTLYTVSFGAPLADLAGNALTAGSFSFTTGSGADTTNNAVSGFNFQNGEINLGTNFAPQVHFSKPVNPLDITTGTLYLYNYDSSKYIKGTVTLAADARSATFTPAQPLLPNTAYDIHMSSGYYDMDANYLYGTDWTFTTGAGQDLTPPQVASVYPANNATSIPLNAQVVVHFSQAINPTSSYAITVTPPGGSPAVGTAILASDQVTLTFVPTNALQPSTPYTVQVSGYADMVGNAGASWSSTFTTATSVAPLNLSTGVDASGNLITIGGTADPHWTVTPSGGAAQTAYVVEPGEGGWSPNWGSYYGWADGPSSAVITVNPNAAQGYPNSTYSTTFDLSSYNLNNLCLVGAVQGDPYGTLLLNGAAITGQYAPWSGFAPINLALPPGGLNQAANTLAYQLNSGWDSYEGFRLQGAIQTCGASLTGGLTLTSSTPAMGATGVATNSSITLTFNHPLDPATVSNSTLPVTVGENSAYVIAGSYQVSGNTVIFTPDGQFPVNAQIYVSNCNGPYDLAGESISGCFWFQLDNFTTASLATPVTPAPAPFQVIAFTPANNATNVGLRAPVVATFNQSFNPNSINPSNSGMDFALFSGYTDWCDSYSRSGDNTTLAFTCYPMPASTTMTAMLNGNLQDWAGDALPNFTSQFTTMATDSNSSGSIVSVRPGNGSNGVNANLPLVFYTSLPINPSSANAGLEVAQNNVALPGTVQVLDNGYTLEFTPDSPLTPGALIQWWTTSNLIDASFGNSFSTASGYYYVAADLSAATPMVQSISPNPGYYVPPNAFFDIQFNTPLNPSTVNSANIYLYDESTGLNVAGTYSQPQPNVVRIVPSSSFGSNDWVYLYVNSGLQSSTSVPAAGYSTYFYMNVPADSSLPSVVSAVPYNGAGNVGVNVQPGVVFGKAIDPVSVNSNTFQVTNGGVPLAGSYWFGSGNTRVQFVPNAPLPASSNLVMTLNGVLDPVGNAVNYTSNFQTGAGPDFTPPTILWSSVTNGESIPVNSSITVQFSESMDVTSFSTSSNFYLYDMLLSQQVPATLTWSADQSVAYLTPTAPLAAGREYGLYLNGGTDLAGNQMQSGYYYWWNLTFYADLSAPTAAPTVINFNPMSGFTVGTNALVEAQFSAPIDPNTMQGVTLSTGGATVATTPILSAGNTVLQLLPATPLTPNATYTMTIAGVKDPAGNTVATTSNNFSTGGSFDLSQPSWIYGDPMYGSTVGTNLPVLKLVFNKPLNPITVSNNTFQLYLNDTSQWIPATVALSANGMEVTMQPKIPLLPNTEYF